MTGDGYDFAGCVSGIGVSVGGVWVLGAGLGFGFKLRLSVLVWRV